ncbi:MAG TPA: dihydropteroate synthase [Myxococcota bacterium]|nr:dihydropteroate synthase [Myxococcota bacterium]
MSRTRPLSEPRERPRLVGVVNVTADSFSDGGRYLEPGAATAHARRLLADGADVVELGPASTHPDAARVPADEEIRRIAPVLDALLPEGVPVSVDTRERETQRYCLRRGVPYLNDVAGFPDEALYEELAAARAVLFVMHSVGGATREPLAPERVLERVYAFFDARLRALTAAGVSRDRLVLDPGMGLFLGGRADASLAVLRDLPRLRRTFELPVMVSVSRKSFLGELTGRPVHERGAATLAAELSAAALGADYVRTHDVAALRDALTVAAALGTLPADGGLRK